MSPGSRQHVILIIDDDADVRDALAEVLEDHQYLTLRAANGEEALEKVRAAVMKPCVILLDMMMPVMDGWQFRASQLNDTELRAIPTVVITAHVNADDAGQLDAAAWLEKPIRLEALMSTVRRFCGDPAAEPA